MSTSPVDLYLSTGQQRFKQAAETSLSSRNLQQTIRMSMPPRPTQRPQRRPLPGPFVLLTYVRTRIQANLLHNDQTRRYNALVWDLPMNGRHAFRLPVDVWIGLSVAGLPKKMPQIRRVTAAQWLAWAPQLNLAINPTDTLQEMVSRYLVWLGIPATANQRPRP
jgi:hypothetical protein